MKVVLVSPLPEAWYPLCWAWLSLDPAATIDDDGPQNEDEFCAHRVRETDRGGSSWGVLVQDEAAGYITYAPMTARAGMLHLCFAPSAWGKGISDAALRLVGDELVRVGIKKVSAAFFADNRRVHALCQRLGGIEEGVLVEHAVRDGQPVDVRVMAFLARTWKERQIYA